MAMDITDTSASSSSTNSLTRKGSRKKIVDYFTKAPSDFSTTPSSCVDEEVLDTNTSVPSSPGTTVAPSTPVGDLTTSSGTATDEEEAPKKLRITAGNGWKAAARLQLPSRKKIRNDASFATDDEMDGGGSLRRHNPRARLGLLPSLPLDILFEVFSHLHPLDILHLARTTKALRVLLLHRSATTLWKDVLQNVPTVPACPEDTSLPNWINLLFDTHCHNCGAPNVKKCIDFYLRVRLCNKCVKTELISEDDISKLDNGVTILRAIPFGDLDGSGELLCTRSARDAFIKELAEHQGDCAAFVEERHAKVEKGYETAEAIQEWHGRQRSQKEMALDAARAQRAANIRAKLTERGYGKDLYFLDEMSDGACAIIPWPDIVLFDDHRYVKQSKPLTPKIWANIEYVMVYYMKEAQKFRLQNEQILLHRRHRQAICNAYVNWRRQPKNLVQYPSDEFMPGVADVLDDRDIRPLIESYGEGDIAKPDFETLIDFPELVTRWRSHMIESLFQCITNPKLCPPVAQYNIFTGYPRLIQAYHRNLQLAVVVFRCKSRGRHRDYMKKWLFHEDIPRPHTDGMREARECMWYPEYIFHPCCTTIHYSSAEERAEEHEYLRIDKETYWTRRDKWRVDERLEFDEKASKIVRNLLEAAGLDWTKTTTKTMDSSDPRFVCSKCTFGGKCDGMRKVRVWSWRDAVRHCFRSHFGDCGVKWECIAASDAAQVRELEVAEGIKRGYLRPSEQRLWKCIQCRDTVNETGRMTWPGLKEHFNIMPAHGDEDTMDELEEVVFYKALDYGPRERPPVRMIPAATE